MKRLFILLIAAVAVVGCQDKESKVVIDDQNHLSEAYDQSCELGYRVIEAKNYDEFKQARTEIEKYEEAFRTQIGGESYSIFLEECNYIFEEL